MSIISYKGWNLLEAMNGLMAYDLGAIDSGIHDEDLKQGVKTYLQGLNSVDLQTTITAYYKRYLPDQIECSEDIVEFDTWLGELLRV